MVLDVKTQYLIITIFILLSSLFLLFFVSGVYHFNNKVKSFAILSTILLLIRSYFFHPLLLFIYSLREFPAAWLKRHRKRPKEMKRDVEAMRIPLERYKMHNYIKTKITNIKSRIILGMQHQIEQVNQKYRNIVSESRIFISFAILVITMAFLAGNKLEYYATNMWKELLLEPRLGTIGLRKVRDRADIFQFMEEIIVHGLMEGKDSNGDLITENGWASFYTGKLVGAVQISQQRFTGCEADKNNYSPFWEPFKNITYLEKYSLIFEPWMYKDQDFFLKSISFEKSNARCKYTQNVGYKFEFQNNVNNSLRAVRFLEKYKWLDINSALIFIDFVILNGDISMFSFVSIMIQHTVHGTNEIKPFIGTLPFQDTIQEMSTVIILLLIANILIFSVIVKSILHRTIYFHQQMSSFRYWVDVLIFIFNMSFFILVILRELAVVKFIHINENNSNKNFLDFHTIGVVAHYTDICVGVLTVVSVIRVAQILQFWKKIKVLIYTLKKVALQLLAFACYIFIFLVTIATAMRLYIGDYTALFMTLLKSLITCTEFILSLNPLNKEKNQNIRGFITSLTLLMLYFGGSIIFKGHFWSIITYYYRIEKVKLDAKEKYYLGIFKFLKMEYKCFHCLKKLKRKKIKNFKSKVIETHLAELTFNTNTLPTERDLKEFERLHESQLQLIRLQRLVLELQIEIVTHKLKDFYIYPDSKRYDIKFKDLVLDDPDKDTKTDDYFSSTSTQKKYQSPIVNELLEKSSDSKIIAEKKNKFLHNKFKSEIVRKFIEAKLEAEMRNRSNSDSMSVSASLFRNVSPSSTLNEDDQPSTSNTQK